ncbi:hypothetical protein B0T20DRAFT_487284 [Sordaria brevicollis]|uniref:Uncharacterized protein n=1 Tax=Sordaria brevicollis TaxID=83679 RepID=A0AAE0U9R5_SORBR|nr:hypothetical protein B0T20DRAFT_487284 [Sordaria brevicollis]
MHITLWPTAFKAQAMCRLSMPTIADIKAMTIAALSASSVSYVAESPEAFEIASMLDTPQGFQTLSVNNSTHDAGLNAHKIMKARHMKSTLETVPEDSTPTDVDNMAHDSDSHDDRKDTTQSADDHATAPLPIADDKPIQVADNAHQADTMADDNSENINTAEDGPITMEEEEKHTYCHAYPLTVDIVEVTESTAPKITDVSDADDTSVSVSSIGHDFERYLQEDKMQWVHDKPKHPKVYTASRKTKKQAIEATNPSTQDGKPIDSDTEADARHHARTLSNTSTDSDKSTDSDATDASYTTAPEILDSDDSSPDASAIDEAKSEDATPSSITKPQATEDPFDKMYNTTNLTPSDLDVVLILERLENNHRYVQMACGSWYVVEDDDEMRQMTKPEYQEFIDWNRRTPAITRDAFNKQMQKDAEEGVITSKDDFAQTCHGIELFEYDDDEEYDDDDEEDTPTSAPAAGPSTATATANVPAPRVRAAWETTPATWKRPEDMDEDWAVIGEFTHPDGQKQIVVGNDAKVYWMHEGMYRGLDVTEQPRFLRWDGTAEQAGWTEQAQQAEQVQQEEQEEEEMEEKRTWVRRQWVRPGKMTRKWDWWTLELETIVEEDESEE